MYTSIFISFTFKSKIGIQIKAQVIRVCSGERQAETVWSQEILERTKPRLAGDQTGKHPTFRNNVLCSSKSKTVFWGYAVSLWLYGACPLQSLIQL